MQRLRRWPSSVCIRLCTRSGVADAQGAGRGVQPWQRPRRRAVISAALCVRVGLADPGHQGESRPGCAWGASDALVKHMHDPNVGVR